MKLIFRKTVTSWLVLPASVLIVLSIGWYISYLKWSESAWWVEHTHQVLAEWLKLGDADIRDLEEGGAVWQSPSVDDGEEGTGSGRDQ